MRTLFYTLFVFLLIHTAYGQVSGTDVSWSLYPDGYIIYNNDGSINRYHAKLQFSGANQNIVTDLLWEQLPCSGNNATKVWWINEDHTGNQNFYGFQTSRPENIVHEFGGDFTYHCGCATTNPNNWNQYLSDQGFTNIIEVPYHIKKFDTESSNYIVKPSSFHWNPNSLEVQTFKGGLIPPIGAGTIEQYGKINLHTGMLPKSITDHTVVMSYGLTYLNAKNMPNLPLNKRYVTANDGEWATNWNNCYSTLPYPQAGCISGYQFNHMTNQQAWDTYGNNLNDKRLYGVVLQDGEFWNGVIETQGLANYKYCFDGVRQNGSTTLFGQHHAQPYYTNRFFNNPGGTTDANLWNAKYNVTAANRQSLVDYNYISAYWQKVLANNTSVADDWQIASLQTYTQDLNPTNMYAWIQDLEINKHLFPEWKHLITIEGFHETPYFATVSHTIPGGALTFTGGQGQWAKHSSSLQEFTGLYSNTVGDGLCYFSDNYTRNDDKSNWIKLDGSTQYPGSDVYARQFYGVDDYLYLGIWKANEVNRQTVGQTWSKPDVSIDGGSTWITGTDLLPASAYAAKRPLVHIINTTAGGKIIMAYNMWNPPYKVQTIKVRDANGVINEVQIKGQFPTLYKYGETGSQPTLTVNPATWAPAATGGSQQINVTSNVAWSVNTNGNSWLSVNTTSGINAGSFTVTAASNPSSSSRFATLSVSGAGLSQTITVTQQGSSTTTSSICLEAESGSGNRTASSGNLASGGQYVGGFGNSSEFMNYSFNVPAAGTYPLHLWYASWETPQFGIVVNGVLQTATAASTNSWSGPFVETVISVNLNAGANTIQLQGTGGGNFGLDKLCITMGSTVTDNTCGDTPQNYCWNSTIPAGQIIFRTAAVEVVAGPKSANDSGNAPASGNCWCIQQYAGQPNCYIYPTSTKDMLLPVTNTSTAMQYRVTVGTGQTGKTAKLYVNGNLTWSKTVTDGELLYPDFSSVTAQSRVYFVIETHSGRIGALNPEKYEEKLATIIYPNPTDGLVKIIYYLTTAETVQLSVVNSEGKLLQTKPVNGIKGQNYLEIDMKLNPSGLYFLKLQSTQKNETLKFIKGK